MDMFEASPEKILYAVIGLGEDFVQCIAVKTDFDKALSCAYQYASDQIMGADDGKNGSVGPLSGLEGDTGYKFDYTYGASGLKSAMYILRRDPEDREA